MLLLWGKVVITVKVNRKLFRGAVLDFGQKALAEKDDCSPANIYNVFRSDRKLESLSIERYDRLCRLMGRSPQEFLVFDNKEN